MEQSSLFRHLYIFYSFVFLLYIFNLFLNSGSIDYILGILAIIMFAVSFPMASKLFKILSSSFLIIGGCLYFLSGLPVREIPTMFISNMPLLILLAMLPWMNSVVRSGKFDRSLNKLMKVNVSDLGKLYTRSSITTFMLTAFLNLSAAAISQDVLKNSLASMNEKVRNSFINTATLRGYSLALLWSPLEILLATSIFITGASYASLLPWLLLVMVIVFILDSIWGRIHFKNYPSPSRETDSYREIDLRALVKKTLHLLVALSIFLALVILLGSLLRLEFILTVTLLIFPFAFVWALLMKRRKSFWALGWKTWKVKTNTMQNFIVLFISLSIFSKSINNSSFLDFIQEPLIFFSSYPVVLFLVIQFIFIFLSLFGVHPVATLGILSGIVSPLLEVVSTVSLAIVFVTSSVATLTVGTYGLVVTLTSMNTGQNPYRITINNLPFALMFGGTGTLLAYFLS